MIQWDPDILVGYEVHKSSWGYIYQRSEALNLDFCGIFSLKSEMISRVIKSPIHPTKFNNGKPMQYDNWGYKKQSNLHCVGRIILNVWRLMRSQLSMTSYTLESVVFHVMHQRIPFFSDDQLSEWYQQGLLMRWRTIAYYLKRVQYPLILLHKTELLSQASEFARIYGMDFYSVLTRGSQFRVEAVMSRITRPENYIMFSPSREDVAKMRALECIALNMEPLSDFYTSPVSVLDFQSLYPSICIAYNYCYSTCLGSLSELEHISTLGALYSYKIPKNILVSLKGHLDVSPNGIVYLKSYVRQSLIGRMLNELLETRIMIKTAMKTYSNNKRLLRLLNAKQLGLKLLANVTYGYTAASFSGRMPCSEIADSIVQAGRATLESSIEFVNCQPNLQVVYADTDSLFVLFKGIDKGDAFETSYFLVDSITKQNPRPITLKFEKIYHPSILLSKKRYVGFMFENFQKNEPVFDAKGIETVRRDGCKAVQKTLEVSLKILFRTKDLSQVKSYLFKEWSKILAGNINLSDFIIAKEVRLGSYSENHLPPGAVLARKNMDIKKFGAPEC